MPTVPIPVELAMRNYLLYIFFIFLPLTGCGAPPNVPAATGDALPSLPAAATTAVEHGSLADAAYWYAPESGERLLLGAAGVAGLHVYGPDGTLVATLESVEAGLVTTVPGVSLGEADTLIVVYDATTASLRGYTFDDGSKAFRAVMPEAIDVEDEVTGLCHYRSRLSGADYLYAVTDAGLIRHYEVFTAANGIAGRLLRTIPSAKGSGFCASDPRDGGLYVAEESNGIWRIGGEAEEDTTREPLDLREPYGRLSDDIKGVAIHAISADLAYLYVADIGKEEIAVYALPEGERVGAFTVEGLSEPEGIAVSADAAAMLAIADEDQANGGSDIKRLDIRAVTSALGLQASTGLADVPRPNVVRPVLETEVIPTWGDSADDPAIWVHPDDPAQSLVIGTGKKSGLYVFDLDGSTLQVLEDGRLNNVDVRDGFRLAGKDVPIVAASNRSNDGIAVYAIDVTNRRLADVADGVIPTGFADPYGLCQYRSPRSGEHYVFVNDADSGLVRQWRLFDNGHGRVTAEPLRDIPVGSQAEGCVADDVHAILYVAEEDVGLWKYSAEPDGGTARTSIDTTDDAGRLTDDVEGIALYDAGDGSGYLVVSNQGANNYAVYRREGDNDFVGIFHVVANAQVGIDGASETDGLDVSSANLGGPFSKGLLVVQDGRNIAPEERQNFKYVAWRDIADALGID